MRKTPSLIQRRRRILALLERYRRELRDTEPSDSLDARIGELVARVKNSGRRPRRSHRLLAWAAAAGFAVLAVAAGILIGMRLERGAPGPRVAQQTPVLPADFSLWPADSVALQIPAEYSAQGKLVAVDPNAQSTGKRYWIDVVVSNDGTVRIDRIVPAESSHADKGKPDGVKLQVQ